MNTKRFTSTSYEKSAKIRTQSEGLSLTPNFKPVFMSILTLFVFLMTAVIFPSSAADSDLQIIPVDQKAHYMCGDTFELAFPDVLSTGHMFTNSGQIQANADADELLLQVRIQMRNMTSGMFHGISTDSFKLTGYVRDRSISYYPETIINTDYFGQGNYYNWDQLPPLRIADILLIYRVNPILINWELAFEPKMTGDQTYDFEGVTYKQAYAAPCSGLFQFSAVRNLENNALTTFERE
ncbi:MAG: hypothetical protein IJI45_11565 [Anaerolineaceae bacterium]|nr:hypothetical protein [Anaerolineaceae bacterium]